MFTGLVEGKGRIVSLERTRSGWRLAVRAGRMARGVRKGGSVAVDGCCLTALGAARAGVLHFDVVPETWKRTTLRFRKPGDSVNLECPLCWGDPIGGHLVQGHVDGTGRVLRSGPRLALALPKALARYAVPKGSIALDGVSLTIASCEKDRIEVALIPETLRVTTLGLRKLGERLNVEMDRLAAIRLPALPRRPTRAHRARPRPKGRSSGARRASRS